jgi:iron-sulfur cluster assembly protein
MTIQINTDKPALTLTPAAVRQVRYLLAKQGKEGCALRIAVKGGGCSGLSYVLGVAEAPAERDFVYDFGGVTVVVDKKSGRFLDGVTLDYSVANLLEGGWVWKNPNAARTCGCGTSFTPK